tara:strand:- start:42 stop:272 length:231 start_codon:yes stop_codon:yes gene_type:complete
LTNSKYFSEIPADILLGIKHRMKNKIFCSYHLDEKLKLLHGQRVCIICNKRQKREGSKRYLQKKELAKSAKFTTRF